MTVKKLSQLYYLNREIERDRQRLEELESRRGLQSPVLDDMPHGQGTAHSKVEQLTAEILDLQAIIHAKIIQCIHERNRLERYIMEIPDSLTRQIFEYRYVDCLPWDQVAECIGDGNTADRVKKICYRYIDREEARTDRQLYEAEKRAEEWEN